ncbi:MAG TPA: acyltransferase [Phnomibacter sp.]|nr:acyltransferase [Phnomibacter sp.]
MPTDKANRFDTLDSLRGIASLSVVIGHAMCTLPSLAEMVYMDQETPTHNLKFFISASPLHFFWNATPAVILFFVLSGFVLSISFLESDTSKNYLVFAIKRVIRLWLPCAAIITISVMLRYILYEPGTLTQFHGWINLMWLNEISFINFISLISLNENFNQIDPALWTLPIEIKLSLLLPVFILLVRNLNKLWTAIATVSYVLGYHLLVSLGITRVFPEFAFMFYFSFFLFGITLCRYRWYLVNFIDGTSPFVVHSFLLIAVFVYTGNYTLWYLPGNMYQTFMKVPEQYRVAIPCMFFILFALSRFGTKFLRNKLLQQLGTISFSLYLVHQVVIVATAYTFGSVLNPYLTVVIAVILSLCTAGLFYKFCEAPSTKLAQYFGRIIQTRITQRAKAIVIPN